MLGIFFDIQNVLYRIGGRLEVPNALAADSYEMDIVFLFVQMFVNGGCRTQGNLMFSRTSAI
jgi:hypothetical protein